MRMIGIKSFLSGISAKVLKRICRPDEKEKLEKWKLSTSTDLKPQGAKRWWKKFISTDIGCRLGKEGQPKKTFQSPFTKEENQVKLWSRRQMEEGIDLCQQDLADEFVLVLQTTVYEVEARESDQGYLTKAEAGKLKMAKARLDMLIDETKKHNMTYLKARLACVCNLVQRLPGNVVPFTADENEMIIKLSWQAWDHLVDTIARGSADELRGYVSEPEEFITNRAKIAIVAQDAVPVYLDISTGRLMRKPDDGPNQDDIILTWCTSS